MATLDTPYLLTSKLFTALPSWRCYNGNTPNAASPYAAAASGESQTRLKLASASLLLPRASLDVCTSKPCPPADRVASVPVNVRK